MGLHGVGHLRPLHGSADASSFVCSCSKSPAGAAAALAAGVFAGLFFGWSCMEPRVGL